MNHMSFTVKNLERSVDFYMNILGLELINKSTRDQNFSERVTGIPGAKLKIAYLGAPNCAVELIQYESPNGEKIDTKTSNVGSAHVCFIVDKFEVMVEELEKQEVVFPGKPSIIPGGPNQGRGVLYFEDPDGNTIEIISNNNDVKNYE